MAKMGNGKKVILLLIVVFLCELSNGGKWVEAQVHHVVGGDHGWDVDSGVAAWASDRTFAVGDFIWFAYSAGIDKDNVVEVRSKEEFELCDVSNPIKMYTDGLDQIPLQEEGIRYFASSNHHNCKKGLKLPVEVRPKSTAQIQSLPPSSSSSSSSSSKAMFEFAQEPIAPSSSTKICGPIMMIIAGVVLSYVAP